MARIGEGSFYVIKWILNILYPTDWHKKKRKVISLDDEIYYSSRPSDWFHNLFSRFSTALIFFFRVSRVLTSNVTKSHTINTVD